MDRNASILVVALSTIGMGLPALCMGACGPAATEEMEEGFTLLRPKLDSVAPNALTLGETVTVVGTDFIDAQDGTMALLLDGTYTDSEGAAHDFIGEIQLDVKNSSIAEFTFEEIFFHPTRDKIGTWRGSAALVSRAPNSDDITGEDESWSTDKDISLRIEPSIMLSRLRSADDSSCSAVTFATNSNNNIELGFNAIGFGEASPEQPWTVRMSFVSPDVAVRYVVPDAFDFWPINGPLDDNVSTLVGEGIHRVEFEIDSGDNVIIDPTRTARRVKVSPPVTIGQEQYTEVVLGTLLAGEAVDGGKSTANFVVEVITNDGRSLRRLVTMDVWSEIEIGVWNGSEQIAERYEAHAVSGCIPGGQIGRQLTYSEGETETRTRSIDVKWNAEVSSGLGFSVGIDALGVTSEQNWSQSFGVDVTEGISSSTSMQQNISAQLLPGYFGMSYRQLERLERKVEVIYHNACGESGTVGEAQLTNWNFAFDVAQGGACPPPTNLPPSEIF
ncbi:MAG: hypothetical protein GY811_19770 [Myxococcales bacterium]|nr:hypothetical protein [Myxococcales bacterium]